MHVAAEFFFPRHLFDFSFLAHEMIGIMSYPDRLYSIFGDLAEKISLREMGQLAHERRNLLVTEGGREFRGRGQVG